MCNKITILTYIGIAILFISPSIFTQNISFSEHFVDNNFDRVSGLFIADIDNDNDQDIIGAAINSNEVALWRNDGGNPIQWTKEVIDDNYGGAMYLCAEDINGDGYIDVIATAAIAHQVCWWSNSGTVPIQWTKHLIISNYTEAHGIMAIDLDKDQKMDIVSTAAALNKITWWKNETGSGTSWIEQTIGNNFNYTQSVCAGDFNLDGNTDIVAAALYANQIAWYQNDGGNPIQWTKNTISNNFSMAHSVEVFEINGDSLPDVLGAAYGANEIAYWQNMGGNPITWEKHSIDNSYSGPLEVCAADIDCDGDIDVAATAGISGKVGWWSNEGGNPIQWVKHTIASNFYDAWPICLADIDNDGDIDVVAGSSTLDEIRLWENSLYSADFDADPISGEIPLQVQFTDQSNLSQTINSWEWDFNYDGTIDSYEQNPVWIYNEEGNYSVYLKVSNGQEEDTEIKLDYINASIVNVEENIIPQNYKLYQNNPNPFNPNTSIRYELPEGSKVSLKIFNLLGKEIAELVNEFRPAGLNTSNWDGKDKNGYSVYSGIYLYSLISKNFSQTKKMLLIK